MDVLIRRVRQSAFMAFSLLLAGQVQAFSCEPPGSFVVESSENSLTSEETRRRYSEALADWFANAHRDSGFIVVGRFFRNNTPPLLHEEQLDDIRTLYWPGSEDVQMPNEIRYRYLGAYRFEGHRLENAVLVPFSTKVIDASVTISAEYAGVVDLLPKTETYVVGVLRPSFRANAYELTTSICPSYHQIETDQVADLLECYRIGPCR